MKLSVIIVNYRSAAYIVNCIQTAMAFSSAGDFEWLVVDNASNDDSREQICGRFPFVKWVEMGYNAGFARANNEAIRQASGNVYLLLNPDTLILDNAIEKCYLKFISTDHSVCGVQLLYEDRSIQISGSYFMKGGINQLLSIPYWGSFLRWIAMRFQTRNWYWGFVRWLRLSWTAEVTRSLRSAPALPHLPAPETNLWSTPQVL